MSVHPGIAGIGQVAIAVDDLERSVEFYRDVMGLECLFQVPPAMAFFDCGGVRLMVTTRQGEARDHRTSVIYYRVEDVETAYEALAARGAAAERKPQVTARMPDHELWIAFVRDPDGNLVGLMEERPVDED